MNDTLELQDRTALLDLIGEDGDDLPPFWD